MTAPGLPEVRQCQDDTHFLFGATAVAGSGATAGMFGIMHPVNGGHWSPESEVADWAVIQPATTAKAAAK